MPTASAGRVLGSLSRIVSPPRGTPDGSYTTNKYGPRANPPYGTPADTHVPGGQVLPNCTGCVPTSFVPAAESGVICS